MFYESSDVFKKEAGHEIDGVWYPRVTKILEIKSKPALYKYYAEAPSFAVAEERTKKSAEEGTLIHEAVEKIFVGEKPQITDSISPAISAVEDFLSKNNFQVERDHVERKVLNKEEAYSGTIDAMAIIDGKFGVLDIKTSQSIYRDYNLQTAAYMGQLTKEFPHLETRWIMRVDQQKNCLRCGATLRSKGGNDKIKSKAFNSQICEENNHEWSPLKGIVELKEFPFWKSDYKAFLAAKYLWQWENEYMLRKIGYLK